MRSLRDTIISSGDASGNLISIALDSSYLFATSAQAVATGSPVGVLKLQFSNDHAFASPNNQTPTNWSDIPNATVSISAAGVFAIPRTELCYQWIRAVYTFTSGTGAITVETNSLGF